MSRAAKGQHVIVLGPDGSGKSTLISGLFKHVIKNSLYDIVHHFHWRPALLPLLSDLLPSLSPVTKKTGDTSRIGGNPHSAPPASELSSYFRLLYYSSDYVAFWPFIELEKKRGALIVFDRYFDDFIVDPKRTRLNPNLKLARRFQKFIPQPDKIIVLRCDAETATQRKPELSLSEYQRQQELYLEMAQTRKNSYVIDTSHSPEQSIEQAARFLF